MTFQDSLKKWFYTQGSVQDLTNVRVPLLDASGNPIGSAPLSDILALASSASNAE